MKIYLDMDGVIADFEAQYVKLFGERPTEVQRRNKEFYQYWSTFVEGGNFAKLPVHEGAVELLRTINTEFKDCPVEILSSSGGQKYHDEVAKQKRHWLKRHGIDYTALVVPGGSKKAEYATKNTVLIDDTYRNIKRFRDAGGYGILHDNVNVTLNQLRQIYRQWKKEHEISQ